MFGIQALGVTPFASQATNIISLVLAENMGLADSSVQLSAFFQARSENIIIADTPNNAGISY